jgi:hypothetical protein
MPARTADNHTKYLAEVEQTYALLEENFDSLYEQAESQGDRQLLRNLHAAARDVYWRGVASALQDGNQVASEIYVDLTAANQEIKALLSDLKNVGALLSLVKQAVRLASSLVTLAAT